MRPLTVSSPSAWVSGPGVTPTHHTSVRVGTVVPSESRDLAVGDPFDAGVQPHLDPAAAQDAQGRIPEPPAQLGQDGRGAVDQQPAQLVGADPRVAAQRGAGEEQPLGGHFGAGVPGADHDERAPGPALRRVVAGVGELQLAEHVVAQVQGLGDVLESLGLLRDAGERQGPGYAAWCQHQPVPAEFASLPVGACHGDGAIAEVNADGVARDVAGAPQRGRERDCDMPRIDGAGADLGKERRVGHVIGRRDNHDLRGLARQQPLQASRAVIPGVTRAGDDDPGPRAGVFDEFIHVFRILSCD